MSSLSLILQSFYFSLSGSSPSLFHGQDSLSLSNKVDKPLSSMLLHSLIAFSINSLSSLSLSHSICGLLSSGYVSILSFSRSSKQRRMCGCGLNREEDAMTADMAADRARDSPDDGKWLTAENRMTTRQWGPRRS